MNNKFKCQVSGAKVTGSYYDDDTESTVKFSGHVKNNELYIETSDEGGLREPLSTHLEMYHNGMTYVNRPRKITTKEAIQELLGFKTYQDFI